MKTLPRHQALQKWQTYWADTKDEFFKVEAVQDYGGEDAQWSDSYKLWLNGDKNGAIKLLKNGSNEWSKQTSQKPVLKRRIRIAKEPYCPYLEWEIMHYKLVNIPYGDEQVYLVNYEDVAGESLLGDFMIFDNIKVVNSNYSEIGKMLNMDFYEENEDISEFLALKERLLLRAKLLTI